MNHEENCEKFNIGHLANDKFIKERIRPLPGDEAYLHLSDLLMALDPIAAESQGLLLDFGCGGSPYRSLLEGVTYRRADIPPATDVDYLIGADGRVDSPSGAFDTILSAQVLEHVYESDRYIAEAFRLLKPGGRLILSTHGSFFDHGCPHDYRRWTADGLSADLERPGFEIDSLRRLTTNMRGLLFLGENYLGHLWSSRKTRIGLGLWLFQRFFWGDRRRRHLWLDRMFPGMRIASEGAHDHLYVCILAVARKPIRKMDI